MCVRAQARVHIDTDIPLFEIFNIIPVTFIAGGPHVDYFLLFRFFL
jgi:hypothetical protein